MELGSEYALPVTANRLCSDNVFQYLNGFHTFYTDSGRSATRLLNPILPCGTVLLPSYICESVLSNHELSLPIDQRYSRDELMYLVDSIRQYKEL